jgi:hypothetical protein
MVGVEAAFLAKKLASWRLAGFKRTNCSKFGGIEPDEIDVRCRGGKGKQIVRLDTDISGGFDFAFADCFYKV